FKVCRSNKLANKLFSHSFNLISFGYQHSQTSAHTDCLINFLKSNVASRPICFRASFRADRERIIGMRQKDARAKSRFLSKNLSNAHFMNKSSKVSLKSIH
ncbi:MAG: hypothetical protein ACRDBF_05210, partial [Plesiomonas shigelloides]